MPTAPPQNVAIQSSTATQLDVTWDPPPVEAQNGDIQGYKVRHFSVLQQLNDYKLKQWFFERPLMVCKCCQLPENIGLTNSMSLERDER